MEQELNLTEFRENVNSVFRNAHLIKRDIRLDSVDTSNLIKRTEAIAIYIDELIGKLLDSDLIKQWQGHEKIFDSYYDFRQCYKSSVLFNDSEYRGFTDELSHLKKYFNYLMKYLLGINHFMMYMEFQELYLQYNSKLE